MRLTASGDAARILYNDRGLAKLALGQYRAAIADFDKSVSLGCADTCHAYDNRAEAYLKLHDYTSAIADISRSISRVLSNAVFLMNIEQFRRIYPEYDAVSDGALAEKLRRLYFPSFSPSDFADEFLVREKNYSSTVLPQLYVRRGDAYAALKQMQKANREYDRVSRAFPKWAEVSFKIENGKRVRLKE